MSDTDEGSDGFDKEAEREKLREKYERDAEKRETTEQMSELLLKGATMTNAHCSDCGDPIFRYDGQEFCPTCQKPVDRSGNDGDASTDDSGAGADSADDADAGANIEVTSPSDEATVRFGGDGEPADDGAADAAEGDGVSARAGSPDAPAGDDPASRESASADAGSDVAETPERQSVPSASPDRTPPERDDAPGAAGSGASGTEGSAAAHVESARVRLARILDRAAGRAEAADDPRTARDHLETAREAAEALAATDS